MRPVRKAFPGLFGAHLTPLQGPFAPQFQIHSESGAKPHSKPMRAGPIHKKPAAGTFAGFHCP